MDTSAKKIARSLCLDTLDNKKLSARLETGHCARLLVGALANLVRVYLHPGRRWGER